MDRLRRNLERRAEMARDAHASEAPDRIKEVLTFIETTPAFGLALQSLKAVPEKAIQDALNQAHHARRPPTIDGYESMVRLSWVFCEEAISEDADREIWNTCFHYRISPGTTNINEMTRAFIDKYLDPIVRYFLDSIDIREEEFTADSSIKEMKLELEGALLGPFPDIAIELSQLELELARSNDTAGYKDVCRRCRDMLLHFAEAIFRPSFLPGGAKAPEGQEGERYRLLITYTLDHCAKQPNANEPLIRLAGSAWTFTSKMVHSESVEVEDAKIAVAQAVLCLYQITRILAKAGVPLSPPENQSR